LRNRLKELGLETIAKTSGSKGLQLYVPLNINDVSFRATKVFARTVAEWMEAEMPQLVVSNMRKELRKGKVLIDWSQNDQHKTTVAVYSLRGREEPTVSTPVTWREVHRVIRTGDPADLTFGAGEVVARVRKRGDLFAPAVELRQRVPDAMALL
jgi:bifunctional non-homologous end joining protein LigD